MSEISKELGSRPEKAKTEVQVRSELFELASNLIERARDATNPEDVRTYAESAAVVFDAAAAARSTDVPPNGGRAAAPTDVPPDGGRVARAPLDVPPNGG